MKRCGIYVPEQDASWELEPNAFEDLVRRHNECDAANCICPKGRRHDSDGTYVHQFSILRKPYPPMELA